MKQKHFVTIRRFGVFINEVSDDEETLFNWIINNVPPAYNILDTQSSPSISPYTPMYDALKIARSRGYTFSL